MSLPHALLLLLIITLAVWERRRPAQVLPPVEGWLRRAGLLNLMMLPVVVIAGLVWEDGFKRHRLLDLDAVAAPAAGLLAYLAYQLALYGWHRLKHASDRLWRWQHQIHHSPVRIELLTAYYAHPLETLFNVLLLGAVIYGVFGLDPAAAGWFLLLEVGADAVAHANVRTPYWLGYLIQRPEMHRLHHETGVHAGNYGLPLWDALFGTWRNPVAPVERCGFTRNRERRLGGMLLGGDVHRAAFPPCCRLFG